LATRSSPGLGRFSGRMLQRELSSNLRGWNADR